MAFLSPTALRYILACIAFLVGALGVLEINDSPLLPGTHWDGVEYVAVAESLVTSGTLETPISHWSSRQEIGSLSHFPPGYPFLLAGLLRTGIPSHTAALWALALGAGGTLALLFLMGTKATGLLAGGFAAAGLMAVTPAWVRLHTAVWSEPVFLVVLLAALYCMWRRPGQVWLHGILAALAVALRYAGVSITLTAALLAWRRGRTVRERVALALAAILPTASFLAAWSAFVHLEGETVRRIGLYGELMTSLGQLPSTLADWLVPWAAPGGSAATTFAALVLLTAGTLVTVLGLRAGPEPEGRDRHRLVRVTVGFMVAYVLVVLGSRIVLDPEIPFDARLAMPLIVSATLLFGIGLTQVVRRATLPRGVTVALATAAWAVAACVLAIGPGIRVAQESGRFFTSRVWLESEVVRWIVKHSDEQDRIYAIEPGLVHLTTGRVARTLPRVGESLEAFRRAFRERPGAIVFTYPLRRTDLRPDVLLDVLDVEALVIAREGAVFVPLKH